MNELFQKNMISECNPQKGNTNPDWFEKCNSLWRVPTQLLWGTIFKTHKNPANFTRMTPLTSMVYYVRSKLAKNTVVKHVWYQSGDLFFNFVHSQMVLLHLEQNFVFTEQYSCLLFSEFVWIVESFQHDFIKIK